MHSLRLPFAVAILGAFLSACATVTPYQPAEKGYGYSEQQLESNRYRISYTASAKTPPDTLHDYLMYRAAELTLAQGYDYFLIAEQNAAQPQADAAPRTGVSFGFGSGGGGSGFGLGIGTRIGNSGGDRYAQAEVLMYKGEKPGDKARAMDAREVRRNLEGRLKTPG